MKVKDLIEELQKFDLDTEVGGVIVSYTEHYCQGSDYCYCTEEDLEYHSVYVVKQEKLETHAQKSRIVEKVWIRGDGLKYE